MSKRAVVRKEQEMEPGSEEEMVKRRRFAEVLRKQMDEPVTEEGLQLWQELMDEIDRARQPHS